MSQVKGSNTKPEVLLQRLLKELKIPFKKNYKNLPGKPDIFIPSLNLVIEINGCFWHGHKNCKYFVMPKSNTVFWTEKIESNVKRDKRVNKDLKILGYRICTIWECDFRNGTFLDKLFNYL